MFIEFINGTTWQIDWVRSLQCDGRLEPDGDYLQRMGVVQSELPGPITGRCSQENDGWALFITTPRGRNHAKAMFDYAVQDPGWFAEMLTVRDTGALTPAQCDEALREYKALYGADVGRAQFEQEYLCTFNAAVLGAFYALEMAKCVRKDGSSPSNRPLVPWYTAPGTLVWATQYQHLVLLRCRPTDIRA